MVMPRKYDVGYKATGEYGDFEVIEYVSKHKVRVLFLRTGYKTWGSSANVAKGRVKDPYHPTVWGVGCIGDTKASYHLDNGKLRLKTSYNTWNHMLRRCYGFGGEKVTTYDDCSVCEEWLCFESYEKWFDKNYIEGYQVDKDLKITGNRVYSPSTCTFVPTKINNILGFKTHNTVRQDQWKGLPVGVSFHKRDEKYCARCFDGNKLISLGYHDTAEAAFLRYKEFKESLIKSITHDYYLKGLLDKDVYMNLQNYKVDPKGHLY